MRSPECQRRARITRLAIKTIATIATPHGARKAIATPIMRKLHMNCARALRQCASQCGERSALVRHDIALAVNLNRDIGRRVGFINLCASAVLALHGHILEVA